MAMAAPSRRGTGRMEEPASKCGCPLRHKMGAYGGDEMGGVPGASSRIQEAVLAWPGVEAQPHRFGGVEYRLGSREVGHIHGDFLLDVAFPKTVRDELVSAGLAQ